MQKPPNYRGKVSRDVSLCRQTKNFAEGKREGLLVLVLITARSFAIQLEPSNWSFVESQE